MPGVREIVIDYESLRRRQDETAVKELCVASAAASETFPFKSPYKMAYHGSTANGLNWKMVILNIKNYTRDFRTSTPTTSRNVHSSKDSRDGRSIT